MGFNYKSFTGCKCCISYKIESNGYNLESKDNFWEKTRYILEKNNQPLTIKMALIVRRSTDVLKVFTWRNFVHFFKTVGEIGRVIKPRFVRNFGNWQIRFPQIF